MSSLRTPAHLEELFPGEGGELCGVSLLRHVVLLDRGL